MVKGKIDIILRTLKTFQKLENGEVVGYEASFYLVIIGDGAK
jgi:hypothetical protein